MKRILSIVLSAAMLICTGVTAMADDGLLKETHDMTKVKPDGEDGIIFEEEIPNGDYTVTVTTGGKTETKANIYINGGERVRAYTLKAGTEQVNEQPVVVTDGKLTVQVLGDSPNVTEIKIDEIAPREKGDIPVIYIAGDSTAQSYNYESVYPQTGWGQVFAEFFTNEINIENRSMGGRSSKSYNNDGRLDRILTELRPGDYVFIQFGINDGAENKPERYISVEDYKKLIAEKYIGETIKRGGIPVLMTATAAAWWDEENNCFMESRADYADPTRELAEELDVAFIDINRIMTDTWNAMGKDEVLSGYFICEPLESKAYTTGTDDHTHLKAKGARKIAELISLAIPEKVPSLAPYLKGEEKFSDISGHWAEEYITALAEKGLVEGDGIGNFFPDTTVTRAEFLKMAMDAAGISPHAYRDGECADAAYNDWYCYYLQGALDKGLIPATMLFAGEIKQETRILAEATEDKEAVTADIMVWEYDTDASYAKAPGFYGDTPITREEMAVIADNVYRYYIKCMNNTPIVVCGTDNRGKVTPESVMEKLENEKELDWFNDVGESVYIDSIFNCYFGLKIIDGMGNGTFAPQGRLTRAQAAAVCLRLANLLK